MKQNNIFFRYFSPVAAQQKLYAAALIALLSSSAYEAEAQVGEPFIHDPSTIALCDGKYYTFGTGEGGIWSEDGWTWQGGAVRPGRGAAPDVLKIGDRYLVAYSATGGGLGGSHRGDVLTMWNKTLDPKSPDFKYTEPVVVASSLDDEDCDAIDAGLLLDPTTGRLWLSYGTYFGFIRLVELDPKTGKRMEGNEPVNIAIDCEATDLIYATAQHDVIAKPEFTGEDAQLWRIEQLTDGTYRIMPKAVPGTEEKLALVSLGDCTPGLAPFDFNSDNSKWNFRQQ